MIILKRPLRVEAVSPFVSPGYCVRTCPKASAFVQRHKARAAIGRQLVTAQDQCRCVWCACALPTVGRTNWATGVASGRHRYCCPLSTNCTFQSCSAYAVAQSPGVAHSAWHSWTLFKLCAPPPRPALTMAFPSLSYPMPNNRTPFTAATGKYVEVRLAERLARPEAYLPANPRHWHPR